MKRRGFTLVELLVAVALGSTLCLGAATLLLRSKHAYLQDEQLIRTLENGHYALRLLSRELSMAGYLGESLPGGIGPAPSGGTACYRHLVQLGDALEHYDNLAAAGSGMPEGCARPGQHQAGSDVLLVRRTMDTPTVYRGERFAATAAETLYLRADRHGAELALGSSDLEAEGSLWRYYPQLFFLRSYSRYRGDGIPALCRIRLAAEAQRTAPVECLVEGVEQLQLEFGVDTDGDGLADRYLSRPSQEQLGRALVARVQLLLRSPLPLPGHRDRNRYQLGNSGVLVPGDRFYRRLLTTSVLLRNSDVYRS